jgi:catechol 2,3-dioxygenase-like lactoylglutathione lyase family enzyme
MRRFGVKVVRVQHVSVNCHGRLDATRRFYAELFEAPDLARPEIPGIDGSWLGLGDVQLHLVDALQSGESPDPVAPHWCLWVDDIDAARAELEAKEIEYLEGAQGDVVQIWISDPNGQVVELQQTR